MASISDKEIRMKVLGISDENAYVESKHVLFDLLMEKYGTHDYVLYSPQEQSFFRFQRYSDGSWLEGYAWDPVTYWGA